MMKAGAKQSRIAQKKQISNKAPWDTAAARATPSRQNSTTTEYWISKAPLRDTAAARATPGQKNCTTTELFQQIPVMQSLHVVQHLHMPRSAITVLARAMTRAS